MILAHERLGRRGGTPLLLVHGLGSASTIWRPLIARLQDEHDIITVDLPGHGRTPWAEQTPVSPPALADHVLNTIDGLGVEQVHLVGNSLGGWTSLELAAAHPERVASVIALAPAGMRNAPLDRVDPRIMRNRRLATAMRLFFPIMLRSASLRRIGFAHNSPIWRTWDYQTCRDAAMAMAKSPGYSQTLRATFGRVADCTRDIPDSIPVQVIFGDTDNVLPASTSQSREYLPSHATWEIWQDCGHAIQLDYPDRVADLIKASTR